MKKALLPLLLIFFLHTNANVVRIGNGTGKISKTSMEGLRPGDTLAITAGTYTGGEFGNLHDITIINNGGVVTFTGQIQWGDKYLFNIHFTGSGSHDEYGLVFKNIAAINAFNCTLDLPSKTGFFGLRFDRLYFENIDGPCFDFSYYRPIYDGSDEKLALRASSFQHIKCYNTGVIFNARGNTEEGMMKDIQLYNIIMQQTHNQGIILAATIFNFDIHHFVITYKGRQPGNYDNGVFQLTGYGQVHHNYIHGGRGWIGRFILLSQAPNISDTWVYNNIQLGTSIYGGCDVRSAPDYYGNSHLYTYGNVHIINNTIGNKKNSNNYSVAMLCAYKTLGTLEVKNNLAFSNEINAGGIFVYDLSSGNGGTKPIDSNNLYYDSSQILGNVLLDTNGYCEPAPGSSVIGAGIYFPNILTDFKDSTRPDPPSIGAQDIGNLKKIPVNHSLKKLVSLKNMLSIFGGASLAMLIFLYYKKSKKKPSH